MAPDTINSALRHAPPTTAHRAAHDAPAEEGRRWHSSRPRDVRRWRYLFGDVQLLFEAVRRHHGSGGAVGRLAVVRMLRVAEVTPAMQAHVRRAALLPLYVGLFSGSIPGTSCAVCGQRLSRHCRCNVFSVIVTSNYTYLYSYLVILQN